MKFSKAMREHFLNKNIVLGSTFFQFGEALYQITEVSRNGICYNRYNGQYSDMRVLSFESSHKILEVKVRRRVVKSRIIIVIK